MGIKSEGAGVAYRDKDCDKSIAFDSSAYDPHQIGGVGTLGHSEPIDSRGSNDNDPSDKRPRMGLIHAHGRWVDLCNRLNEGHL